MTQLDMELEPPKIQPHIGTQAYVLLQAFYRGERLTVLTAIQKYEIYALSQRCSELKRLGWPIQSQMVETTTGKHVACYWIEFQ